MVWRVVSASIDVGEYGLWRRMITHASQQGLGDDDMRQKAVDKHYDQLHKA